MNENDDAAVVFAIVAEATGIENVLVSVATAGVSEANENAGAAEVFVESAPVDVRFNEKPTVDFVASPDKLNPEPKPENVEAVLPKIEPVAEVVVGTPNPEKTGTVVVVVLISDFDSGAKLFEAKENPLVVSFPPDNIEPKLRDPDDADTFPMAGCAGNSSFFSEILNVNDALSLLGTDSGFFSITLGVSFGTTGETLFARGIEKVAVTATFAFAIVEAGFAISGVILCKGFMYMRGA